ncbi:MAG: exopolyphosphatase/guanosine-5'-triphosphate,3'-diphosphate pyrophosphatase [Glaciecola sp.]|jgi:exopolyphosphatase/guanosine-5'-triphosphate,3'-diphosphate pyrophosphatase
MSEIRYAAVDIGSNAIRLVVVSLLESSSGKERKINKISLTRVPIRLGEDVFKDGKVSKDKSNDLNHALTGFSHLMKAYRVKKYKACATSALRSASNSMEVLSLIKSSSGIDVEIIDGNTEAEYIMKAGVGQFLKKGKSYLYIDVGGGSTELSVLVDGEIKVSASFNIGTVRVLKKGWDEEEWERMRLWLNKNVADVSIKAAIGTGGNINRYYKLCHGKNKELSTKEIAQLYLKLKKLSYDERVSKFNLRLDRADVIVPAGKIFLKILKEVNVSQVIVPKLGLADGIIRDIIE